MFFAVRIGALDIILHDVADGGSDDENYHRRRRRIGRGSGGIGGPAPSTPTGPLEYLYGAIFV